MKIITIDDKEYMVLDKYDYESLIKLWILIVIISFSLGLFIGWWLL